MASGDKVLIASEGFVNTAISPINTKLDGIEEGATADQTASEVEALYEGLSDTNKYTDAASTTVNHIAVTASTDLDGIRTRVEELDATVVLQGEWDASAGTFPNSTDSGQAWIVSTAGTVDSVEFSTGDRLLAVVDNAVADTYTDNWLKLDYTDKVSSVAGKTGAVVLTKDDISLSNVSDDAQLKIASNLADLADVAISRQNMGTEIGVDVQAYDVNIVSDDAYVHTDNNLTTALKDKLDGIEDNATADQTGSEIKTAYENNSNTNAYIDSDKTKVDYMSVTQAVDLDSLITIEEV